MPKARILYCLIYLLTVKYILQKYTYTKALSKRRHHKQNKIRSSKAEKKYKTER